MQKKVSIIMGIYNCANTLGEAIESLLQQTYHDWELIMCDDGSQDNTYEIAEKFSKKYENIIVFQNERNMGLNYTLNRCLERANGVYIARMDGDDISFPRRLEKEVDFLERHKEYAIVSTNMVYFDENGDWGKSNMLEYPQKEDLVRATPFCHAPCMVRSEAYETVKGYSVDKRLLRMEDYHLWIKMYSKGYKGYNIKEPLYKMRDDSAATKRRTFKSRINEAYVRYLAIKMLKLPKRNVIFIFRPIILGLCPNFVYERLHKKKLQKFDKGEEQ